MAKDLAFTTLHDLDISNGDIQTVSDGAEVAQSWKIRMYWLLGEWYYNLALGMPWFSKIFNLTSTPVAKRQIIMDCTLGTPGVRAITKFEQTTADRVGTLEIEIETEYNTNEVVSI